MANFKTHLSVATGASCIAASSFYSIQLIELFAMPWFIFLGMIGGLLPDIDSDNSHPLKLLFIALATLVSVLAILAYQDLYTLPLLFIVACLAFFIVRYPILAIFRYFTVHRGVFHSLLSAVFFTLLTTYASHTLFHRSGHFSWLSGIFIGFGFIIHLILDEFYSVDIGNVQIKRSFGTAIKLFSLRYLHASFLMLVACTFLYLHTPAFPFAHQDALSIINLAFEFCSSTLEKYFFRLF